MTAYRLSDQQVNTLTTPRGRTDLITHALAVEVQASRTVIDDLEAENERLRRWKSEASTVIDQWEAVWETAGRPGELGRSKSEGLTKWIIAERALADQLAAAAIAYRDERHGDWDQLDAALVAWETRRDR
jgi:hypothetical protein